MELEFYEDESELSNPKNKAFRNIIGSSKHIRKTVLEGMKAAKTDFPIVITGETGTGKEILAKSIHSASSRAKMPMVCINCAALPLELLESELFGYADGAFTGARKGGKKGKFLLANGGTLFLDEIGDMPLSMQAKLLRVLQENEIDPVGSDVSIPVNVRIISATHCDLLQMMRNGEFRKDLYFRLSVININMPPLRNHLSDVPELSKYFLSRLNREYHRNISFSPDVIKLLQTYNWHGNVRELSNVIKGAYAICRGNAIEIYDLPSNFKYCDIKHDAESLGELDKEPEIENIIFTPQLPIKERLERIEYNLIKDAYARFQSVRKAAVFLGMSVATFVRKKNKYEKHFEKLVL